MGYCPFSFCVGSRYNKLYCDTGAQGHSWPGRTRLRHSKEALRHGWPAHRASDVDGLAVGVCRDTIGCIVIGGACLVSQHSAPGAARSAQRPMTWHRSAATCAIACATRRGIGCIVWGRGGGGCDKAGLDVVTWCTATWQDTVGWGHDTTPSAWLGSFGCAPCALDPALTQSAVLSHCLWTLFMNTVHLVFKKIK